MRNFKKGIQTSAAPVPGQKPKELSGLGVIDKIQLVLPKGILMPLQLQAVEKHLKPIEGVKQGSSKGDAYQKQYIWTAPSGAKTVFGIHAADERMKFDLKMTFNPSHLKRNDCLELRDVIEEIFGPNDQDVFEAMKVLRIDQAYDFPVSTDNLIVVQDGSPVEEKYFVSTDSKGHIQTWYCGSVQSKTRWAMYDQVASDEFKLAHGELPSRPKARDNAELVFEHSNKMASTRIEVRRVFSPPLPMLEIDEKESPLGKYKVYEIDIDRLDDPDPMFFLYLESVRLRGIIGAGNHFLTNWPNREGKRRLKILESTLRSCIAPWWKTSGLNASVKSALRMTPSWKRLTKYLF